ncbi:MAG TPA: amino acid adenylation domain-containing protein [Bryobacteraceae bacterium]|nr:amino acid adenylation domain-containing protein [Bryobacteraceae bacterium]
MIAEQVITVETPRATRHPASFAQRRLWFLHAFDPSSPLYNIPCAVRRQTAFELPVFQRALDEIVRRHESLRTTFILDGGEPVQVVAPIRKQHVALIDLQKLPEGQRLLESQRLAFLEGRAPFDLERGPLLRASVLLLDEGDQVLLFTFHHIVADGGSIGQFFGELAALEAAFAAGEASPLPDLPAQYADYARWQRDRLRGPLLEEHLAFWRQQLAGAPALVELPLDRPRPKVQGFSGATLPVVLDPDIVKGLKALCRETNATMFMALLAGFFALLHRYTGQTDIVLGTPIALRQRPEFEPLIGLFVNMLVLRVNLEDRPSALKLLHRVRELTIDAYSHQELPFERLVEDLQPERSQAHQPLVQAVLVLQTAMVSGGDAEENVDKTQSQPPAPAPSVAKFDLTLSLLEHGGQLIGGIEFNTDLFDAGTVFHLIERFKHLLKGMIEAPDQCISKIPLLDAAERERMLVDLNRTEWPWAFEGTIIDYIWSQAAQSPDEIAVIADAGESLTYRDLIERADAVAAELTARGSIRGQLVPVCFYRSADLLVALLGILRSGAAYVPLDPDQPPSRTEFMVHDIGATLALAAPDLASRLPSWLKILPLDAGSPADAPRSEGSSPFPEPDDTAYAIFTSGSTGKPKCAANHHAALLNRLLWMQQAFGLKPGDRVLQKTPYTFDVSVWELFWPLMAGATVVFARPGEHGDSAYLIDVITRRAITVTHFVPSMLRVFLDHPQAGQCASLRRVITSGEALPADQVSVFHSRLGAELHNLYGPTECAIDVTHWHCMRGIPAHVVPIGYPIANVRTYILDPETLEPVPPGAKGELFIAGRGVGRGYVNRPDLTAASFLPDLLDTDSRMYRSGDLARYRVDGSIEYLGRADQQIKLRGFRIEAGEVEAALRNAPGVADAVVTVRSTGSEQQLVAHCVPDPAVGRAIIGLLRCDREGKLDDRLVEEIPNGLLVVARSRSETEFVYQEVFADRAYLRCGVDLRPGDVVLDVGANIGLFALFVGMTSPGAKVYSFEPIPETFELLAMNAALHDWDISARQVALGAEEGTARFTYYPNVSILSGRYADAEEEQQTVLAYERGRGHAGPEIEELIRSRLESQSFETPVKTLSQVIAEEDLERIDLLKVDAEKSELDVLAGIAAADWPKIQQVVAEVHEIGPRLTQVCELLYRNGFEVAVEQEETLGGSGLSMVFARRPSRGPARQETTEVLPALPLSPARLQDQIRSAVARHLPEYMVPSRIIWVEELPRLSSGKIDRKSLPQEPAWLGASVARPRSEPPRTPLEVRIAQLWSEALGRAATFGRHDGFFTLGGHSLMATSVIARIRDLFRVEVSLREFFAHPTIAGLAECIESGDARSSDLLDTIPHVNRGPGDYAPLSFSQQRLWFLDRFSPGEIAYNIPVVLPIPGPIDAGILERSLSEIVRRHEILRTSFPFVDERPVQQISSDWTVRLRRIDVSSMDAASIDDEVHGLAVREVMRPFDLTNGPLFRALLIRAAPDRHHLVLTMHHTASDGWSMGVLYRELATIYEAFSRGQPSPLPELPVQFSDFAAWQRRWMTGDVLERQVGYWREQLAGAPKLLVLPTDHARPAVQSTRGDIYLFDIDPQVNAELAALAQREICTPFMAMLAAFNVLLYRLCGARDICVGAPIANRRRPELEGLIGFFVNTIVLRTRWEGDPSFRSLMHAVRDVTLGAFAHQDMPFEHMVAELEPERAMDRSPIFQVMLILQNVAGWDSTGLVGSRPLVTGAAKFDLSLFLLPAQTGLVGMLEYRTDLFTRETAACLVKQFCEVLAQVAKAPDAPISRLPLLTGELTGDQPPVATEPGVLDDLIALVDATAPEAAAILWGSTTTSYGELVGKSKELAARLEQFGLRRGDAIAVAIAPSPDLIVSLLAVRRIGGAYLVIDPEDPPNRREALLGSAVRALLISGEDGVEVDALPGFESCEHAPGDRAALIPEWNGDGPVLSELSAQALAWRLEHSPIREFAGRHVACSTPPALDAAVYCLASLYHGSCLILPTREPSVAPRTLARTLISGGAEALVVAPAPLQILAREFARSLERVELVVELADPGQIEPLRTALPSALLARCRFRLGIAGFGSVSVYPEGAQNVTLEVEGGSFVQAVTAESDPAPLGAFGELALSGPGLARPNMEAVAGNARPSLLRTGVRVIRAATGQIRLRSGGDLFRRAAADVELAVSRAAGGSPAVVTYDREAGDMVAFVVRSPGVSEVSIREELATWLPPTRHPKSLWFTGELPRRPEGGIDIRALLLRATSDSVPYVAPRTELEHGIARIWTESLGVERVGLHDDFFSLGGHSLLATHVIARLNGAFGIEIPLRTLFEYPTIEGLSRAVDKIVKLEPGTQVPRLERSADSGPAPLSFAQQRLWFLNRYEPGSPFYNVVGAYPLQGRIDQVALERAINILVERHESLRLTFVMVDWEPVQRPETQVHIPVPLIDLRALPPEARRLEAERLRDQIARESFDLEKGPLLRVWLIRLEDDTSLLLLSIHHIAADGWSLGILNQELAIVYSALVAGQTVHLAELPLQYTDYARWQRAWLNGEVLTRQLSIWRRMLAGAPPLLQLPSDRPRPPSQAFHGGLYGRILDPELIAPLRELSRSERATTFMTLFAAYAALLSRYTGRDDIVAGIPIANRRPELAGMIGLVANTLVLRVSLSGTPSFRELVGRVRAVTLESYEHQDTPFEKLVEDLQPDRDPSFNPLFQVMFTHQTTAEAEGSGAREPENLVEMGRTGAAKFDSTMFVMERAHEISIGIEYNAYLFTAETVSQFVEHYERLLRGALQDPNRPLVEIPLAKPGEIPEQKAATDTAPQQFILEGVEALARAHPSRLAVVTPALELTWSDLMARSNGWAAALRNQGLEPETPVGIFLAQPVDELAAMLGSLQAGLACVPLDRCASLGGIQAKLAQAGARVVATDSHANAPLSEVGLIAISEAAVEGSAISAQEYFAPSPSAVAIIEASIRIPHSALAASVRAEIEDANLTPGEHTLIAELRPSLVLHDALAVWLSGGTVVLADADAQEDAAAFCQLVSATGATRAYVSPVLLRQLAQPRSAEELPRTLRDLVVCHPAGIAAESLHGLQDRLGGGSIFERLVPSIGLPALRRWQMTAGVPRSQPRPGVPIQILDARMQALPPGIPGALYLALQPDSVPEALEPTGVSGRWTADGSIQILGRTNALLRVRGYEVDRDRVESALRGVSGVREVAVVARAQELAAFIEGSCSETQAHMILSEQLPAFMVPRNLVLVPRLPRTASGEVDHERVSAIQTPVRDLVPARTPLERSVADAFSDVFGRNGIGLDDEFLALGGRPSEARAIALRLSEELGAPVDSSAVLLYSTIERLTIALTQRNLTDTLELERLLAELESLDEGEVASLLSSWGPFVEGSSE